jgi:hypothetical protein
LLLQIKTLKSELSCARGDAAAGRVRSAELQGQIAEHNKALRRWAKSVEEDLEAAEEKVRKAEMKALVRGQEHREMKASKARICALSADNEVMGGGFGGFLCVDGKAACWSIGR